MRTKGLREFKQGLVSYKEEYKRILNYKQWKFNILNRGGIVTARMGKGNYSYGLLRWKMALVVLMLAVVDYCWLLMVATGCWMIAGYGWDTASRWESLWIISKSRWGNLAKTSFKIVLEYFEEAMKKFEIIRSSDEEIWQRNCLRIIRSSDEEIWQRQILKLS